MNIRRLFLVIFCALQVIAASAQEKHFSLTILHTNDTHSQLEPCSYKQWTDVGGVLRRSAFIDEVRATDSCVLLVDAGDFSQGTPYFNMFKGRAEVALMNILGYDASTLGNHEFDNGLDTLAARLKEAKFTVVCANYKFKSKALQKYVKPYTVIEKCGIRIGIFGLSPDVTGLVSASVTNGAYYQDPIKSARYAIKQLKKQKCDMIICLSHLGYFSEKPTQTICDKELAKQLGDDIDIIIGGHTHSLLEKADFVNGTPIVQTGCKGINIGKIKFAK